ncbi:hypothetical protein L0664_00030 [Octadecabacter sp. G9-8]|uniref:Uncharacterized protein n=1 Tax=Octadecabacter dasysiphoniae TaxID=2909341 RepID=A0ABS9CQC7_9RHOB|nr:hypothetical protein [Octadecabacter dasysiphoniae]MCF2869442.1 hypothetical protein [Octadecabacter dasysiphoniae]
MTAEDLSQALEICKKSAYFRSVFQSWRTDAWLDVIDYFGKKKSKAMFEAFEEMEKGFRLKRPRVRGMTADEEFPIILKDFRAEFPLAPQELIRAFGGRHQMQSR